jgi:hypothetical protein
LGRNREKPDGLTKYGPTKSVSCHQFARNERGDGTIIEALKDPREEEVTEVIWPVIGNNQPVCSQGAIKMVAEVREGRGGG